MVNNIPAPIKTFLIEFFQSEIGSSIVFKDFLPVTGGCINHGGKLTTSNGVYFLKWNDLRGFPKMFETEAKGILLLSETKSIRTPSVITHGEIEGFQFLMEEFLYGRRAQNISYWEKFGLQLARLHQHSNAYFGLGHDNYIGSLPQLNKISQTWTDFFIGQRLEPQLQRLIAVRKIDKQFMHKMESIYPRLEKLMPKEPPSLLHGDLWSGNVITGPEGTPYAIDPAVYYGHREAELAFTKLFGGFDESFYEAYENEFPLKSGFEQRMNIYNIYPLLVHANLFGGSYLQQVKRIIKDYL